MPTLVLVRHGESTYNRDNRFTGHIDAPLTDRGREEARAVASKLPGIRFDRAYTSALARAVESTAILLSALGQPGVPVVSSAALNERHYGELQGLNKAETKMKFGAEQVRLWRRSFDVAPPGGESLKDTAARALPYFQSAITAELRGGANVLVLAHGNSLRAIVMSLENLTPEQILQVNIATGEARIYELDDGLHLLSRRIV